MTNATPDFGPVWSAGLRRGGERELGDWLAFALTLCDTADEMARAAFRRDMVISTKPDRSYVTETDQAIERVIRERIADAHPGHGVIGEEYGTEAAGAAVRWYIDPIDGTHNFMRGVPLFGTLIGIERDGELQVGVISAPMLGGRWYARRGGGAWAFDAGLAGDGTPRRISVSNVASIADAQLLYGSAQDVLRSGKAPGFELLLGEVWRDRGFGDFWGYALVAEGAGEAMVEAELSSWDMAGPLVVVEEAGGRMTSLSGERTIHERSALASNGILHEEILARLRGE
jgi:histidinol-phosphatase